MILLTILTQSCLDTITVHQKFRRIYIREIFIVFHIYVYSVCQWKCNSLLPRHHINYQRHKAEGLTTKTLQKRPVFVSVGFFAVRVFLFILSKTFFPLWQYFDLQLLKFCTCPVLVWSNRYNVQAVFYAVDSLIWNTDINIWFDLILFMALASQLLPVLLSKKSIKKSIH